MPENQRLLMRLHPVTLFCYMAAVLGIAMFCLNPVIQVGSLLFACICLRMLSERIVWRRVLVFVLFTVVIAGINPLFYHNGATVLFYLNGNRITLEAIRYGACTACMFGGVFLWCRSLSKLFGSDRILCLLGAVSPKAALVCSMTLRFLPMYVRQMEKTKAQQRILGLYQDHTLIDRAKGSLKVFAAVTTWALEHSMHTADSMQARGYGTRKRTQYRRWRFGGMDAALCSWMLLLLIAIVIEIKRESVSMRFYPVTDAIPFSAESVFVYLGYAAVCLSLPAALCFLRCKRLRMRSAGIIK